MYPLPAAHKSTSAAVIHTALSPAPPTETSICLATTRRIATARRNGANITVTGASRSTASAPACGGADFFCSSTRLAQNSAAPATAAA